MILLSLLPQMPAKMAPQPSSPSLFHLSLTDVKAVAFEIQAMLPHRLNHPLSEQLEHPRHTGAAPASSSAASGHLVAARGRELGLGDAREHALGGRGWEEDRVVRREHRQRARVRRVVAEGAQLDRDVLVGSLSQSATTESSSGILSRGALVRASEGLHVEADHPGGKHGDFAGPSAAALRGGA